MIFVRKALWKLLGNWLQRFYTSYYKLNHNIVINNIKKMLYQVPWLSHKQDKDWPCPFDFDIVEVGP